MNPAPPTPREPSPTLDDVLALWLPARTVAPGLRRRIQRLTLVTGILTGLAIPFGLRYAWLGLPVLAGTTLLALAAAAGNLALLQRTREPAIAGILGSGIVFGVLLVRSLHTGGFDDPTFGAFLLVPVLAALTAGVRAGWAFAGVVLLATGVLYGLDQGGFPIADQVPRTSRALQSLLDRGAAILASAAVIGVLPWGASRPSLLDDGSDPDSEATVWEANRKKLGALADGQTEPAPVQPLQLDRLTLPRKSSRRTVSRLRILAVDDELGALLWLQAELAEHEVRVTTDVNEATTAFVDGKHDVLVCGLAMAGATGADVYRAVRALAPQHAARMVFITGSSAPVDATPFEGLEALVVLRKPLDPNELRAALRQVTSG